MMSDLASASFLAMAEKKNGAKHRVKAAALVRGEGENAELVLTFLVKDVQRARPNGRGRSVVFGMIPTEFMLGGVTYQLSCPGFTITAR
jgi:hypothetical protein